MQFRMRVGVLICALALLCAPAAFGEVVVNEQIPMAIGVFIPCAAGGAGEVVVLEGNLHILVSVTTVDGGFHLNQHLQPQGVSGLGLVTGDKYQGTGVTRETVNIPTSGGFTHTFVNNFRIIGQGPGNNFLVHQNVHVTFTPDGTPTASVDNLSVECK